MSATVWSRLFLSFLVSFFIGVPAAVGESSARAFFGCRGSPFRDPCIPKGVNITASLFTTPVGVAYVPGEVVACVLMLSELGSGTKSVPGSRATHAGQRR